MNLDQLSIGNSGTVAKLTGAPAIRRRLMEMGITAGATITAIRRAPLGDPLEVKIRGYQLSLRKEEATAIELA